MPPRAKIDSSPEELCTQREYERETLYASRTVAGGHVHHAAFPHLGFHSVTEFGYIDQDAPRLLRFEYGKLTT